MWGRLSTLKFGTLTAQQEGGEAARKKWKLTRMGAHSHAKQERKGKGRKEGAEQGGRGGGGSYLAITSKLRLPARNSLGRQGGASAVCVALRTSSKQEGGGGERGRDG